MSRSQRRTPAKSALELAESSEWAALERLVAADPGRADELDDFGMTPLHWACTDTHVPLRVVRRLASARPDALAQPNKAGLVPLQIAIKAAAKLEVLQHLANARTASVLSETPAGETAAELAHNCGLTSDKLDFLSGVEQRLRAEGRAPSARPSARLLASQQYMEEVALGGSNRSARKLVFPPDEDDDGLNDDDQENRPAQSSSANNKSNSNTIKTPMLMRASSTASTASASTATPASKASMSTVHTLRFPPHSMMMNSRERVPLPPRWRLDKRCNICQLKFSYFRARHHCRNCGESVCSTHSNARAPLPHLGLAAPQRVCILCFDELLATSNASSSANAMAVVNLLPGRKYSTSSLLAKMGGVDDDDEHDVGSMTLPAGRPPLRATQSSIHFSATSSSSQQTRPFRSPSAASVASDRPSRHLFPSKMPEDYHGPTVTLPAELDGDDELAVRPRAWTDLEVSETHAERQEQLRELEAHSKELESAKRALRESLARTTSQMHAAVRERMVHERTVAELRDNRIIDINRISLGDDDELGDDDNQLGEGEEGGSGDKAKGDSKSNRRSLVSDDTVTLVEDTDVDAAMTSKFLGQAYLAKHEYGNAVAELQRSVEANRRDPDVWYNLAQALLGNKQLFEAERAAERALSLSARSYAAMSLLGKILHAKGEHERAIGVFQDALSLMENDEDSDEDVGSMTVGW